MKKTDGKRKAGRKQKLSRLVGICLSVILLLSDSLPAYAAGTGVSAGDGTSYETEGDGEAGGLEESGSQDSRGEADVSGSGSIPKEESVIEPKEGSSGGAAASVSGGDGDSVSGEDGDSVSGEDGDSVSGGDGISVSAGDAGLVVREPEMFYREPEPENYGELVSYDAYSRTYHAGGNRYVTVIGNDGTTYIDEDGVLRPVNNTLVENPVSAFGMLGGSGASYMNSENAYTVLFPENMTAYKNAKEAGGIVILNGDFQMLLYPADGSFAGGLAQGNAIRYSNVFPDVDYQYTVLGNSVKEDIILLERGEKNSFSYYVDTCGLAVSLEGNVLYLYEAGRNPKKDAVFVLEAPEMEDAAGEISFGVKMTLSEADGLYLVTVTADREWLDAPERAYPVRIDPTAVQVAGSAIRLACAEEGSPNKVIGDNQYPYAGYDDGITSGNYAGFRSRHLNCRTYFSIDYDFQALSAEAEITSATLLVTQKTRWSRGTTEFGIFGVEEEWKPESLSWNSQLSLSHTFLNSCMAATVRGEALSFDVTEAVSAWVNGAADNRGLVLKALAEAPDAEAAAAGAGMQCEVFYGSASAAYGPKLVLSWTGEPTELSGLTLDDTTIEIYPVVERSGDKSTSTLGVVAHGLAKPGSRVVYSLINGATGEVEAETSLVYPDSALYADAFPAALAYNRRLSNWQSAVFTGLVPRQVYYITAYAEETAKSSAAGGTESGAAQGVADGAENGAAGSIGKTVVSDSFLIYEEGAFDLIPRIAAHYGVELDTVMSDMQMQDALTRQGNLIFIRNPQNTAPYEAGELSDYWKSVIDGLLLGRAQYCEFGFEPVNLNTGNFYMEQADAVIADIGGDFAFTRRYNSLGAGYAGSLGFGWSTPFDERLGELSDGTVLWLTGTGRIVAFAKERSGYRAPEGQMYALAEEGEGFAVTDLATLEKHLFNAYGQLVAVEDACGSRTALSYGMDGRLAAITSPSGKMYTVSLDGENRISAIGLPDGKSIRYSYDGAGNLVSVTDEAGDTLQFSYDGAHRMTAWQDENGNCVVANIYDEKGRVIRQTDAEGGEVSLSYGDGRTGTVDANGNETVYYYDGSFRTVKIEYPDGSTESRAYNGQGFLSSATDRQGISTAYTYDGAGRVLTETRQDGAQRRYTYTAAGLLQTAENYDGGVTTYAYDEKNRPVSVTDAEGGVTAYVYDGENRIVSMTDAEGNRTDFSYSGACVTAMTDAEGNSRYYTYDAMNRLLTETDPEGNTSSYAYDAKGRRVAETDAEGNTTYYTYDAAGNVTAITDREGQKSTFSYDKANRMLSGTDALGNTLSYTYDANGNRLTETDAEGNVVSYTYDAMNRIKTETDAEGRVTAYTYDRAYRTVSVTDRLGHTRLYDYDPVTGALLSRTDERGNRTVYELDVCGRVTEILYADGSSVGYTYDRLGRITAVTDKLGTVTYLSYDKCGNPVSLTDGADRIYTYEYDACNRPVKTINPLGGTVVYVYNGAGNLVSTTDERGNSTYYDYDGVNRLAAVRDALDGLTSYAYDGEGRPVTAATPEGRQVSRRYDAIGQLLEMTEQQTGENGGSGTRTTAYTYDSLSRMLTASDEAGLLAAYDYDACGNVTRAEDALGNAHTYEYDAEGRLVGDTYPNGEKETFTYLATGEVSAYTDRYGVKTLFAYDAMGRVTESHDTAGNRVSYEYDAAGNLTQRTDVLGRSVTYTYDAFGRVTAVTDVDGAVTFYAYDALDRLVRMTDAAGNETAYEYDAAGNLIKMTKPGEAVYTYEYDALNRLSRETNPEGAEVSYAYDGDGNLTAATDGNGIRTSLAYDAFNRPVIYTDGNGGQTLYAYDIRDNLTAITSPEGITEQRSYDPVGNLLAVTDGTGETWKYEYDVLYRMVRQTSPLGAVESYTYDSHDVITGVTDALGALTAYEVNANGQVERLTQPNGGVYAYTYDEAHRLTGITTPLGYETTFSYSMGNDIIKQADSLGRTVLYEYDVLHNLVKVTDAEGGVTTYGYDSRGNRTVMTNALGDAFAFSYGGADKMTVVTDSEGGRVSAAYDMAGNITGITLPGNRTVQYGYDGNYNTVSVTDPKGYVYQYNYDGDNRLTGAVNPLAETEYYGYDAADRLVSYTDRLGLTEYYAYDAHGNLYAYTATDGRVTNYTYDIKDRLISATNSMGSTAYYAYDVMGNLTGVTDYMGRGTKYTYDLEGNLTSVTDAAGRQESFAYDAAGRLLSHTYNSGNTVTYDYDKLNGLVEKAYLDAEGAENGEPVAYAYNALGERVSMYDETGDTVYEYDSLGRLTSVTTYRTPENGEGSGMDTPENGAGGTGFSHAEGAGDVVAYAYDEAGNLSAITYPDGSVVRYRYDLNNNLVEVADREGNITTYVYDAINRITEIHRPGGISTYNTYDAADRITELTNICDDCGWVVSRYAYEYDDRGFIVGETATESLAGYAWDEKHDGKHEDGRHDALYSHGDRHAKHGKDSTYAYQIVETVRAYAYDGAGRLLSATETEENRGTYTYSYEYDAMGNRTSVVKTDENGEVVESRRYAYNESSQPVSVELYDGKKTTTVSYTYDADGNLISETGRDGTEKVEKTYLYAAENRLLAVYDGKELLMAAAYDGDGNRVFRLNYNLHTDGDLKGNSGNGNGSSKDNGGSGNSGNGSGSTAAGSSGSSADSGSGGSGSEGGSTSAETVTGAAKNNGNAGNSSANNGKGGNGKDNGNKGNNGNGNGNSGNSSSGSDGNGDGSSGSGGNGDGSSGSDGNGNSSAGNDGSTGSGSTGNGNATNAETNNSQNQCGILFPIDGEISAREEYLISLIKTSGKEKNYELIEYITDVNRPYAEVLVEQNCNGAMDTAYVYGAERLSLDRFDGSTGCYLYDPKGSVTGITNGEGQICRSYRYGAFGEITYGAPQYENIYAYNGESYNPNVGSLYLRARYYNIETGAFFTEDGYLGNIREPLTLNRYAYCEGNPVNYEDPSGHIMLGNSDMPGFIRGEVNGETVFYFPDSFSDYAENCLAQKAEENQRFMDNVEEFLLYNPVGQGISVAVSAVLSPVTGTAVLLRDQHLAHTYGETRDETADFFEVNNNLLAGVAGSFHGTYQFLRDPACIVFGAAYVLEKPDETIFRDPLERPLAMVDAFWEGDNKGSVRYAGQTLGYAVQFAVQAAVSRQTIQSCKKPKVQDRDIANVEVFEDYMDLVEELDVSTASNTAIFYSGPGNRALAEEFAKFNDKVTLEMTSGGAYLDSLQLFENCSSLTQQEAINVWARLSARYAQNANGNVYGFVNGSWSESIFNMVEYPELLKNSNVTNIFTEFMK